MTVTQKDIAKRAGVTKATVSYALRDHPSIPIKTRERIQEIAQGLGYQNNPMLASLSKLKNRSIHMHHGNLACIVGHPEGNPISRIKSYELIYQGLKERAEELNFAIDLFWAYDPRFQGERLDKILQSRSICGIALLGISETELTLNWSQYSVAYATSARRLAQPSFSNIQDDLSGILEMTLQNLLKLGYQRIGLCIGKNNLVGSQSAFHGCLAYMRHTLETGSPADIPLFPITYQLTPEQFKKDSKRFEKWYHRFQPEIIISESYNEPAQALITPVLGNQAPQKKIVNLALSPEEHNGFAGIQINQSTRGRMAMDLITKQIFSNNFGPPEKAKRVIMDDYSWAPGDLEPA